MRWGRFGLAAALIGVCAAAHAQTKAPSIGLLWVDSVQPSYYQASLVEALGRRGYAASRNIRIEDRTAREDYTRLDEDAAALARAKVDVIVTYGGTATLAAARATKQVPIVMVSGTDPVAAGLAASLGRPGGNVTGLYTISQDLGAKRMELLKEMAPAASRIGILLAAEGSAALRYRREYQAAAGRMKLDLKIAELRSDKELPGTFRDFSDGKVDVLLVAPSTLLNKHAGNIVALAASHRLPAVYASDRFPDEGGLMSYGTDVRHALARAADYVDRVLKGAKPAAMPIEQPTKLELVVNLRAARALGLAVPKSILLRADRVIE